MAVFALFSRMHLAAERVHHVLQAITNAENGNAQVEYALIGNRSVFVVNRGGASGQNNSYRRITANLGQRRIAGKDNGKNVLFTDAARNQLRILSAKVEDDDGLVFHG